MWEAWREGGGEQRGEVERYRKHKMKSFDGIDVAIPIKL